MSLPSPGTRFLFAEKAIKNLQLTCQHATYGSSFKTKSVGKYNAHLQTCLFKPIECPLASCNGSLQCGLIVDHLKEIHQAPPCAADVNGMARVYRPLPDRDQKQPIVLKFDGQWCHALILTTGFGYSMKVYNKCSGGGGCVKVGMGTARFLIIAVIALLDIKAGEAVEDDTFTFTEWQANESMPRQPRCQHCRDLRAQRKPRDERGKSAAEPWHATLRECDASGFVPLV